MKCKTYLFLAAGVFILWVGVLMLVPGTASAHCDTLDGPVVQDAKTALEKGDVTPVLKFVHYTERIYLDAVGKDGHFGEPEMKEIENRHKH